MESRDENGHHEKKTNTESLSHTVQTGCALEKFNRSRENGIRKMRVDTRVDFVKPQRKKQESTPLPHVHNSIGSGLIKMATKGLKRHTSLTPDAMTWANTWEMMNRTLEAFATRNTESCDRGGDKSRKTFETEGVQGGFGWLHRYLS